MRTHQINTVSVACNRGKSVLLAHRDPFLNPAFGAELDIDAFGMEVRFCIRTGCAKDPLHQADIVDMPIQVKVGWPGLYAVDFG